MKKGTIVLVQFPFTDFTSFKRRPALILSVNNNSKKDIIVTFISSILPSKLLETDLLLETDESFTDTGLHRSSVVKLDKIMTLNIDLITGELGRISDDLITEVDKKIKIIFDL